jgi:hypothetical protein
VVSDIASSLVSWDELQTMVGYPAEAQTETEVLLEVASAQIESYCGRVLREAEHVEIANGYGDAVVVLRQWPVREVIDIRVDRERAFGEETAIDPGLYSHDGGCVYLREDLAFPEVGGVVRVRYRAGFDAEAMPLDVRMACVELVMWRRQRIRTRQVGVVDVVSLIRGAGKTTFESDLPSSVRELLSPYVRRY